MTCKQVHDIYGIMFTESVKTCMLGKWRQSSDTIAVARKYVKNIYKK